MQDVVHHSRKPRYRYPQGALPAGTLLRLALDVGKAYENARVHAILLTPSGEMRVPMTATENGREARLQLPEETGLCWYYFAIERPGGEKLYYGGESGEGKLYPHTPPGYQITLYSPAFETPRWFREGIMYQVFPDRFCHAGDSSEAISYHRTMGRHLRIHENWAEQPYYLPEAGSAHYAPNDFFLGDLAGIAKMIPYLERLGVTCLYLNPVFESASNHRYDTGDYKKIDPLLGTNEEFRALSTALQKSGIRIMLDGVFSHTGADSLYFNKYGRYPSLGAYQFMQSPYRDWYEFHPMRNEGYKSWWGFPELPEVKELSQSYTEFVMDGEQSLLRFWAAHGASSWRLDVADELPDAFIQRMRARLKEIDPEAVLLGEVWEDASNKEAYGVKRQYVEGNELDSVMNYPFQNAVCSFLTGGMDAFTFAYAMQMQRERYPKPFYYALMNLVSSHDSIRALNVLGGAPERDALSREEQAKWTLSKDMLELAKRRLLIAAAMQMVFPGVPCIYYGDEIGMTGMADPFNRGTYAFGEEDTALLAAYERLTSLRKQHAALRSGYCRMGACTQDVFALVRYTANGRDAFLNEAQNEAVLLLANRSQLPVYVRVNLEDVLQEGPDADIAFPFDGCWADAHHKLHCRNGVLEAVLPACSAMVLTPA